MADFYVNNCVASVRSLLPEIPAICFLIQTEAVFKKNISILIKNILKYYFPLNRI